MGYVNGKHIIEVVEEKSAPQDAIVTDSQSREEEEQTALTA
jgi:hypothetical protein